MIPALGPHIVLLGMPGAGKTTVGRMLGASLNRPFRDSDEQIEDIHAMSGRELAAAKGVEELHRVELEMLGIALGSEVPSVVAAAASVGDQSELASILSGQLVVFLDSDPLALADRQGSGGHRRPLDVAALAALMQRRRPRFVDVAHLVIDTAAIPPDRSTAAIVGLVRG